MYLLAFMGADSFDSSAWCLKAAYGAIQLSGTADRFPGDLRWRHQASQATLWRVLGLVRAVRLPGVRRAPRFQSRPAPWPLVS